jgi:hypothetical protein
VFVRLDDDDEEVGLAGCRAKRADDEDPEGVELDDDDSVERNGRSDSKERRKELLKPTSRFAGDHAQLTD